MSHGSRSVDAPRNGSVHHDRTRSRLYASLMAVALAGSFCISTTPASADTIFSVTGNFANGAAFESGSTVTIDTVLGITTASNLQISAGFGSPPNTFTEADIFENGAFQTPFIWRLADGTELDFFMPVPPDFVGFSGGTIGLVTYFNASDWGYSGGSTDTVLMQKAPEPNVLSLVGIGLLGLMGIAFRRKPLARLAA
jgi:hypothetical protein